MLNQRGQQQEMMVGVIKAVGYSPPLAHIAIEGAYRLFAIVNLLLHVFFFLILCRLLITAKEFTSMSTSTAAPPILFIRKIKKRETYRRSPFVFVVSFVTYILTRSLIACLVYLVLYYPG